MRVNLSKYKLINGLLTIITILSFSLITINSISATTDPATIDNITPNQGPTTGNQTIVINGDGFKTKVVFDHISAGDSHTCAIASDNQVYCWGRNDFGQLGNNSTANSPVPVAVKIGPDNGSDIPTGSIISQISIKYRHSCAITSDNKAYCWGMNGDGQLGNGSTTDSPVPVAVKIGQDNDLDIPTGSTITQISAGGWHTCAIASDGKAYCWGDNYSGQLGNGSTTDSPVPVAVKIGQDNDLDIPAGSNISQISAGSHHTCVITTDNQVYCWGSNSYGELGNNSTTDSPVPVAVKIGQAGFDVVKVSAGMYHTCAITSDGKAYCWGGNIGGQLGNNSTTDSSVPVAVKIGQDNGSGIPVGSNIRQISAEGWHTCAVASDNQAYCWGRNEYGELGNNSTTHSPVPVVVIQDSLIISVAFGNQTVTNFDSLTNTQITLKTPAHPIGTVDLTLIDDLGRITTLAEGYTYTEDTPPPSDDDAPSSPSDKDTSLLPPNTGLTHQTNQPKLALITGLATIITLISGFVILKLKKAKS